MTPEAVRRNPGAELLAERRCRFVVWAPFAEAVSVVLVAPAERIHRLERTEEGYHLGVLDDVPPGSLYFYELDGRLRRPDPASRSQPRGVHGPSEVVSDRFDWHDGGFRGVPLEHMVFYELHVGTFTAHGTFDAVIEHLDELAELGVNVVELMPVAQFDGERNWGYDGVYPWCVHATYGGAPGLRRLVDACHARGLSVALDVVYNHLGPEGNVLGDFGPYFTERHRTPWGAAVNFDEAGSDFVRDYFVGSALYYVERCHIDVLRVDAVHAIIDTSARPFLRELTRAVHRQGEHQGRNAYVVAESDLNDARVIESVELNGLGMDAQWSDDFHHALHALLTEERAGYYEDFGGVQPLAKAYQSGYVYTGQWSRYRQCRHGSSPATSSGRRFIVASQNHDQVGNRARGDRLAEQLGFGEQKLAAAVLLLSPFVPLLFMGQEYGETNPFAYFTSHARPDLALAVREGRRREFARFGWRPADIPDPQDERTFENSRLDHGKKITPRGSALLRLHRALLTLRRARRSLSSLDLDAVEVNYDETERVMTVRRRAEDDTVYSIFAFGDRATLSLPAAPGGWVKLFDTEAVEWGGLGGLSADRLRGDEPSRISVAASSAVVYGSVE